MEFICKYDMPSRGTPVESGRERGSCLGCRLSKRRSARLGGGGLCVLWPKGVGWLTDWLGRGGNVSDVNRKKEPSRVLTLTAQCDEAQRTEETVEEEQLLSHLTYQRSRVTAGNRCDRDVAQSRVPTISAAVGRGRAGCYGAGLLHQRRSNPPLSRLCSVCGMWRLWSAAEATKLIACYTTAQRQPLPLSLSSLFLTPQLC